MKMILPLLALAVIAVALAACSPFEPAVTPTSLPTRTGALKPYTGPAASVTPSPTNAATVTPLPSATPTPRTHVVHAKEDLWGIALRYGLTLEDLLTANPTVDPRFLSIGANLMIPAPLYTSTPDAAHPPLPTPVGLDLVTPVCYPSKEGGLWCFTTAANGQEFSIEALSVAIRLYDQGSGEILSQTAYAPLNLVPPGGVMALSAYFPAPAPVTFDATAELLTSLPVPPAAGRFLAVQQPGTDIEISADGLSAVASGTFQLSVAQVAASRIRAAAIAFDSQGRVTGIRQWESLEPLSGSALVDFQFTVYAAGSTIDRVVVLVEAYP
ncbi:MAG: LysM domain-containing protein [Bellilinea sp.]